MGRKPAVLARLSPLALYLLLACSGVETPPARPGSPGSPPSSASAPAAVAPPEAAWQRIQAGALLVDVRTPAEFEQGHLEGALNIPHGRIGEGTAELGVAQDREIVLYCRSGRRSGIARDALVKLGYQNVVNAGGYEQLRQAQPAEPAAPAAP